MTMRYDMRRPCDKCPFRRGALQLSRASVRGIVGQFANGSAGQFVCHKTAVVDDDEGVFTAVGAPKAQHCAGALIFAEKHSRPTQMMRIAERLGFYDHTKLEAHDEVYDSLREALAHASPDRKRRTK